MTYSAENSIAWRHPDDYPPPYGSKVLLWMPTGVMIIGNWHNSGAALWAPLLKVPLELKERVWNQIENRKTFTRPSPGAKEPLK